MKIFVAGLLWWMALASATNGWRHARKIATSPQTPRPTAQTNGAITAGPVTVGIHGNEPLVAISPDGTLYISALQHLYRSTNNGASWTELAGPIYASQLNLNSDSSISVDPGNRLY